LAGAVVLASLGTGETCWGSEKKMSLEKKNFGVTADGKKVDEYTLTNVHGLVVKVMTYGGIITSVETPDRQGKMTNITLSLDSLQDYLAGHPFFGAIAGRYANRIAKGKFTLDGKVYTLATNDGPNHLHGGKKGFDKAVWQAEKVQGKDFVGVKLTHFSPDGDEGYPGNLTATVVYSLNNNNELKMEYTAATDKATPLNLTNHTYWNLGGRAKGGILDELMMINADGYLPVDDTLIPTGKPAAVKGTPMDFTTPTTIGARIDQVAGGYDHAYVLNQKKPKKPGQLTLAAKVVEPASGRVMEVFTTQPAIQFYTGNFLDGKLQAGGVSYRKHHAFCLETEHYPDSPNQPQFPSTILRPGETYHQVTVHKFSVAK
jgi:aldose 1-epimerase